MMQSPQPSEASHCDCAGVKQRMTKLSQMRQPGRPLNLTQLKQGATELPFNSDLREHPISYFISTLKSQNVEAVTF